MELNGQSRLARKMAREAGSHESPQNSRKVSRRLASQPFGHRVVKAVQPVSRAQKHKLEAQNGFFKLHPTARLTLYFGRKFKRVSLVEPTEQGPSLSLTLRGFSQLPFSR